MDLSKSFSSSPEFRRRPLPTLISSVAYSGTQMNSTSAGQCTSYWNAFLLDYLIIDGVLMNKWKSNLTIQPFIDR